MSNTQESFRWHLAGVGPTSISVIEPPAGDKDGRDATVPFGFARELVERPIPAPAGKPDTAVWEGMGL